MPMIYFLLLLSVSRRYERLIAVAVVGYTFTIILSYCTYCTAAAAVAAGVHRSRAGGRSSIQLVQQRNSSKSTWNDIGHAHDRCCSCHSRRHGAQKM